MNQKKKISTLFLLLLTVSRVMGQGLPCDGADPDATCPLDSWIIVLVIAAGLFTTWTMVNRKNKRPGNAMVVPVSNPSDLKQKPAVKSNI